MSELSKVVLLESIDEYEEFQKFLAVNGSDIDDYAIVALEGKLQLYFKKIGIHYQNTLSYFGNESIQRILLKWDKISKYLEENIKYVDNNSIRNVYVDELLHYLELMFNYMAKILEILEGLYEKNSGIELYACGRTGLGPSVFIAEDRLLGILVRQFAESKNIRYYLFGEKTKQGICEECLTIYRQRASFAATYFNDLMKKYIRFFKKSVILISTSGYGFRHLMKDIQSRSRNVIFISPYDDKDMKWYQILARNAAGVITGHYFVNINPFSKKNGPVNNELLKDQLHELFNKEFNDNFEFQGVDLGGLITDKVEKAFLPHLTMLASYSDNVKNLIQEYDVKLYMSPLGRGLWCVIAEHFSKAGRISLFISHGTHPEPTNKYHEIAISNMCRGFMLGRYSHVALSTPVQEAHLKYFKDKYNMISNKTIKVGPLNFSHLKDADKKAQKNKFNIQDDEIVITHAVSVKVRSTERYWFIETFDELISSLSDIINMINASKRLRLIVRVHPNYCFTNEELQILLPISDKVMIHREGEFSEVLAATDILISYSSTTIDEALLNNVPVLLYDKWDRYNHFNTGVYENPGSSDIFPVCYVNSEHKLKSAVEYLAGKVNTARRERFDVSKYRYDENYNKNYFNFIESTLNKSEVKA